jgi:hypothetical protein
MKAAVAFILQNGRFKKGALEDIAQMYMDQSILLVDSADEALEIEKKKHNREIADLFLDFLDRDEKHEVKMENV